MTKSEEYRLNAEECERMARRSSKDGDKQDWLSLARSWRQMIEQGKAPARNVEGNIDGPERDVNDTFEST